jgi:hypothetical protein
MLVASCTSEPACPLSDDGMREGLLVLLQWPENERPPGQYELIARADGVVLSLAIDWDGTRERCDQAPRCMVDALVDGRLGTERLVFEARLRRYVVIGYDENEHGGPDTVELEVRESGRRLALEMFTPTYDYDGSPECSSAYRDFARLTVRP